MKLEAKSVLGRWIALALFAASLAAPQTVPSATAAPERAPAVEAAALPSFVGSCEARLRQCINGGGNPTQCWNAYWQCTNP